MLTRPRLRAALGRYVPIARLTPPRTAWLAFNGIEAARAVARHVRELPRGTRRPAYMRQRWTLAGTRVFVLPSTSGAARRGPWDGRATRLEWWTELAGLAG